MPVEIMIRFFAIKFLFVRVQNFIFLDLYYKVRKCITAGYFTHAAKKDPVEGYKTLVEGQPVYIHPSRYCFRVFIFRCHWTYVLKLCVSCY